jgi:chitin disaccharide deacetylase
VGNAPNAVDRRVRLIITADDFGRDAACTEAIADALSRGVISATSLMANAPMFDRACALARTPALMGRIGVHLCLDEGPPLSPEMRPYEDSNGHLCVRRSLRPLPADESRAIESELRAQIERVIAAGIQPTHLDSHRHIHTTFPIGRLVVRLARRYGISYVRPARTIASRSGFVATVYKRLFNRYIRSHVGTADHFGDIVDFFHQRTAPRPSGLIECMTHLDESARGLENRRLLEKDEFAKFVEGYELIGHAEAMQ